MTSLINKPLLLSQEKRETYILTGMQYVYQELEVDCNMECKIQRNKSTHYVHQITNKL